MINLLDASLFYNNTNICEIISLNKIKLTIIHSLSIGSVEEADINSATEGDCDQKTGLIISIFLNSPKNNKNKQTYLNCREPYFDSHNSKRDMKAHGEC